MRYEKKSINVLFLLLGILVLSSCRNHSTSEPQDDDILCCCPHATIVFQPYGTFSEKEVEKLIPALEENMNTYLFGEWKFKVLKPIPIPFPKEGNRFKAINFLNYQKQQSIKDDEVLIGLTHEDICYDIHGVKNYGIIGLSFRPGNVSIISDRRVSKKSQTWKPILHEFVHAFYGKDHCPNDDPTCFMKDAKGKANLSIQNKLCDSCRQ